MMLWKLLHPGIAPDHLGLIPDMLHEDDPRPAKEQFNERYSYGGGWRPMSGFTLHPNNTLTYPEDPPLVPLAQLQFRDELIVLYEHAWIAIIQKSRYFEVCRMD